MIYKEKLERDNYYKFKKFNFILVIIFTFCLGYFSYPLLNKAVEVKVYKVIEKKENHLKFPLDAKPASFSVDSLKAFITALNIKHPDIVFAQAVQETGHFKSNIFKENNNLFGMKMAYQRPKTAIGIKNGHAEYNNWKESVIDYALWQNRYANISNRQEYLEYLGRNYAEDKSYLSKLNQIIKQNE